jgi:hypothetical protein
LLAERVEVILPVIALVPPVIFLPKGRDGSLQDFFSRKKS